MNRLKWIGIIFVILLLIMGLFFGVKEINKSKKDNNCKNGIIVNKKCLCYSGYSGTDCSISPAAKDCPEGCSGHGNCNTSTGNCECDPEYTGTNCSIKKTPDSKDCLNNCSNHGTCDSATGKCICKTGFAGTDCSTIVCSKNCGDYGQCVDGNCKCNDGYKGDTCQTKIERGYIYSDNVCNLGDCGDNTENCWHSKLDCENNNPVDDNYIYYDTQSIKNNTSWGNIQGVCTKVPKATCTKGLNKGGDNYNEQIVNPDTNVKLCYNDDSKGIGRCLSDFYSNKTITNSEISPDYWYKTSNQPSADSGCEKATDNKYCCPGRDNTACGNNPGQYNHRYSNDIILNNSCFIGKDNCISGTHTLEAQNTNGIEPIPQCNKFDHKGNCPVIKEATTEQQCKDEASRNFWTYAQGPSQKKVEAGGNKYCVCYVEQGKDGDITTSDKYRVTKFVNGKCYVTTPSGSEHCWKVGAKELSESDHSGACYDSKKNCEKNAAKAAYSWYGSDSCFANS